MVVKQSNSKNNCFSLDWNLSKIKKAATSMLAAEILAFINNNLKADF